MVRTACFHCWGHGLIPGQGTKILQIMWHGKQKNTVKIFIFKSIVIRFPNSLLSLYAFFTHIQEYAHPCEQQGEKAVVMYVIWLLAILVEWEIAGSVGRRPVLSTGLQHYQWPWANHWQSYSLGFSTWKWSLQKVFQDTSPSSMNILLSQILFKKC